ncbi:prepilin peptidase [uncultured Clostridium sp.]|uniref:A24 family peptidase n=1 Tax=uncultured Clostridium sp. TaxID=59620 RepID=UPI00262710C4|nr:A24 family peptidase [uncultured Clostridium sp.]
MLDIIIVGILILVTGISAYTDYKEGKIKNIICLGAVIFGISINLYINGIAGAIFSIKGILIPFAVLFILFAIRAFGAGDIKLLCGIGAIMGWQFAIDNFCIAMIVSLVFIVFTGLLNKELFKRVKRLFSILKMMILFKSFDVDKDFEERKTLAFGVSIFIAMIVQIIFKVELI